MPISASVFARLRLSGTSYGYLACPPLQSLYSSRSRRQTRLTARVSRSLRALSRHRQEISSEHSFPLGLLLSLVFAEDLHDRFEKKRGLEPSRSRLSVEYLGFEGEPLQ
jgi:hypothetical protein